LEAYDENYHEEDEEDYKAFCSIWDIKNLLEIYYPPPMMMISK
jgi:hypothetical protein